jgi:hypothetical protein
LGGGRAPRIEILWGRLGVVLLVVGAESVSYCAWFGAVDEVDQPPEGIVYGAVGCQKLWRRGEGGEKERRDKGQRSIGMSMMSKGGD